jgi:hypothetical protein
MNCHPERSEEPVLNEVKEPAVFVRAPGKSRFFAALRMTISSG